MKKVDKKNISDIFALTPVQEGIFFHYLNDTSRRIYINRLTLEISGLIDIDVYKKAWTRVIAANGMLRTVIRWENLETPVQIVLRNPLSPPGYSDFSSLGVNEALERLKDVQIRLRETINLTDTPFLVELCKTRENFYTLIIANHHILYDGWSTGIILREFIEAYRHFLSGGYTDITDMSTAPPKTDFKEFIRHIQNQDTAGEEQFWKTFLSNASPFEWSRNYTGFITEAGTDNATGSSTGTVYLQHDVRFEDEFTTRIDRFVKENKITAAAILYSAWGLLLQQYHNASDTIFGIALSGRSAPISHIEDIVGLFINTLPLRIISHPRQSAIDLVHSVHRSVLSLEEHENASLVNIKRYLQLNDPGDLFDTIAVVENYPLQRWLSSSKDSFSISSYTIEEIPHYNLTAGFTVFDGITLSCTFNPGKYSRSFIRRMTGHYIRLLEHIVRDPGAVIPHLDMLTADERQHLLEHLSSGSSSPFGFKTLDRLFREQVERNPDRIVLSGAQLEPPLPHVTLTYRALHQMADYMAARLNATGIVPGQPIALIFERSIEMAVAVIAILYARCAYLPIEPGIPRERIRYMLDDSNTPCIVTLSQFQDKLDALQPREEIILMDRVSDSSPIANVYSYNSNPGELNLDDLPNYDLPAYIIYTSGSTGRPKGVAVSHRHASNTLVSRCREYNMDQRVIALQLFSYAFDGFVTSFFSPILSGGHLVLPTRGILENIGDLIRQIVRFNVTHFISVPSLYRLIIENMTPRHAAPLQTVTLAGENWTWDLVESTTAKNEHLEIVNEYGVTEAAVMSTIYRHQEKDPLSTVKIGRPIANTALYITRVGMPEKLQPVGVPGEICLAGSGVAHGYLNNPELTSQRFVPDPFNPGNTMFTTRDIARWLPDGNLIYHGRLDHQVKIRGFRIEPGEIESHLSHHPMVTESVVITRQTPAGDGFLCAYFVPRHSLDFLSDLAPAFREHLARELPYYMIPAHFIPVEKIPLTLNGKLDRKSLPEPGFSGDYGGYTAPAGETEKALARIWADILKIPLDRIGRHDHFFRLGGHSLNATQLVLRLKKYFRVEIPIPEIFNHPELGDLASYIDGFGKKRPIPAHIPECEQKEYYPLSFAQKRMLILNRIDPNGTGYNMPALYRLEGPLDKIRLQNTFDRLIQRHRVLRTAFTIIGDQPVQWVHPRVYFSIQSFRPPIADAPSLYHLFVRPFDLSRSPLLRVALMETGTDAHILMVDMHHIISDGISTHVIIEDFAALYSGRDLPHLQVQYADFAQWQQSPASRERLAPQKDFWIQRFRDPVSPLDLPLDYARPTEKDFNGGLARFRLQSHVLTQLKSLAQHEDATLFNVVITLLNILLAKLARQEDIVIGSPVSGRRYPEIQNTVGIFINTLPLRNYPSGKKKFRHFLREVKHHTLEALENQEYPFEELVEQLGDSIARDTGRNPLFDVMFSLQNFDIAPVQIPGLTLTPLPNPRASSRFDLSFTARENDWELEFAVEYGAGVIAPETMARWIHHFETLTMSILNDQDQEIAGISMLTEEEKRQLLQDFNRKPYPYLHANTVTRLFRDQVDRTPETPAIQGPCTRTGRVRSLLYHQLDQTAEAVARELISRGVRPGDRVGLRVYRSIQMIAGILGILKARAAYVPLNPREPLERTGYILRDCRTSIVLTLSELFPDLSPLDFVQIISIDRLSLFERSSGFPDTPLLPGEPTDDAYVIFTSGSSGKPKGVPITHANLAPLLQWGFQLGFGSGDRVLQNLSYYFDWSAWEIFTTLCTGAALYIIPRDELLNPHTCIAYMSQQEITVLHITPTQWQYIIAAAGEGDAGTALNLKYLLLGAEKLSPGLLAATFNALAPGCRVFNCYGPTEAAILSAVAELSPPIEESGLAPVHVSIGKSIANADHLILDRYMKPCPVNVPGELYIAGDGVARGYLNDPQKTHNAFIPNTFRESGIAGKYLYRTGDLCRWLPNKEIEFHGRIDYQVKIRGFRIEPGEIERCLLRDNRVKHAVVLEVSNPGGERSLCAYIVPQSHKDLPSGASGNRINDDSHCPPDTGQWNPADLRGFLSDKLPDYMIPSNFIAIPHIPLNPNGKIDRKALPVPEFQCDSRERLSPRDNVEELLTDMWSQILQVDGESISMDDDFFRLGGHSLKATLLVSRIHEEFDVRINLTEFFKTPTVSGIARLVSRSAGDSFTSIPAAPPAEIYPLSSAQKRLFILNRLQPAAIVYNLPGIRIIEGRLDVSRFQNALDKLVMRHQSLRTSFSLYGSEPVQRITDGVEFYIGSRDLTGNPRAESLIPAIMKDFVRPFDLSRPPLLRLELARTGDNRWFLLFDMHHIISDGVSMSVLLRDLITFYQDREDLLPELPVQYKDYAVWQNNFFDSPFYKKQEDYWLNVFSGPLPVLNLVTDYSRPEVQAWEGNEIRFSLDRPFVQSLDRVCSHTRTTRYMILLAIFNILLAKYTGQEDIVVGLPIAGRNRPELQNIFGFFVNTLAVRNFPRNDQTFDDFLSHVKQNALDAFQNQDYAFEHLVNHLSGSRDMSRNPVFDVMFVLQEMDLSLTFDDFQLIHYTYNQEISHFDLHLQASKRDGLIDMDLQYSTALFKESTARDIARHYMEIAEQVVENPGIVLKDIEISQEFLTPRSNPLDEDEGDFGF